MGVDAFWCRLNETPAGSCRPGLVRRAGWSTRPGARGEGFGCTHQQYGGDDGDDEAKNVELEDATGAQRVGDDATDHGAGQAEEQGGDPAEVLFAGLQQTGEGSDDEAGDDESDHELWFSNV